MTNRNSKQFKDLEDYHASLCKMLEDHNGDDEALHYITLELSRVASKLNDIIWEVKQ